MLVLFGLLQLVKISEGLRWDAGVMSLHLPVKIVPVVEHQGIPYRPWGAKRGHFPLEI